jgi:uncharacterized repeat protein (TIGR01451 family)
MKKILAIVLLLALRAAIAAGDDCQQLSPPKPPAPTGQFGCSVDLHGSSLVVGSNLDGGGSITFCHQASDTSPWTCDEPKVMAPDGRLGDEFGRSASVDEDWLAVGAPFADGPRAGGSGVVYLFRHQDSTPSWVYAAKLSASDGARGDQFGLTLALSGNTLVVGAPNAVGTAGSLSGVVYVFHLDGGSWAEHQKLTAGDAAAFDNFGFSLGLDGSTLVVGAPFHDRGSAAGNAGTAYVFQSDDTNNWSQKAPLLAGDGAADDEYGASVSVSGDTLVVGARADDVNGLRDAGSAYIYQGSGATWNEVARFFGAAAGDHFGAAVSVSGNQMLIGALLHGGGSPEPGAAYLFARTNGTWAPEAFSFPPLAVTGRFGQAVSVDGKNLLVGAYLAPGGGSATVCREGVPPVPHAFTVVKTDHQKDVLPGATLTYSITVTNTGDQDAASVQVTDTFSAKLRDVSCQLDCVQPHPGNVQWTIPLAAHASKTLTATATVRIDASGTITNEACAQAVGESKQFCGSDDPDEIAGCAPAALKLVKTAPASVQSGHTLTYSLTVTNPGTCPATGVHIEDPIPAELQAVSATPPCLIQPGKIVCDLPDLASLASQTVHLRFDVPETCTPTVANQATVSSNDEGLVSSNTVSTAIARVADVTVTKTGPASVQPGGLIPYVLTVKNLGPDIACGVVVSDPIPAELTAPVFPGGCSITSNAVRCPIGTLAAGALQMFPVSFTAPATCVNPIVNKATVSADPPTADPQPANDSGTVTTTFVADLSITKTVSRATASPGDTLTYTIVVSNPSGSSATVTDVFPAGLTSVFWCQDVDNVPCIPNPSGPTGDLHTVLNGSTATYRVQGTVSPTFLGTTLVNTATVAGPPGCVDPNPSNNSATVTTPITPSGVIVLCQGITGSQLAVGTVTYTFLLVNNGPVAQSNDMFSDSLPPGLTPTAASASSGTVTLGNPVTWHGPIPVSGTVTITITAMIGPMAKGTFCNAPTILFDRDGDGTDESVGAVTNPCCFTVPERIPTLSGSALAVLALLLALTALRRLRHRPL